MLLASSSPVGRKVGGGESSLGASGAAAAQSLGPIPIAVAKEVLSYNYFPVGLRARIIALRCVCE